jgi:prophage regulatory protein
MAIINLQNRPDLMRIDEVLERTGKRRSTIYRDVRAGRFPPPVKTGLRSIAWRTADITEWILSLAPSPIRGIEK